MFEALFKYPETIAHWIIILPVLSFVLITLKLTVNRNAPEKPKVEKAPLTPEMKALSNPATSYLPVLGLLVLAGLIFLTRRESVPSLPALTTVIKWLFVALICLFTLWPYGARRWAQKWGPYISVGAMALASVIATSLWIKTVGHGLYDPSKHDLWHKALQFTWFTIGGIPVDIGIKLDGFAIFGVWMVTVVATCIQWFSLGYMWDDDYGRKHIGRYFAEHSLFAVGMLAVVLSDNILTFLIGWEIMGLCSYLLIGFYTYKPSANAAQLKAFITTRIGDVGFMLGIFLLGLMYFYTKNPLSFNLDKISDVVLRYEWGAVNLGWLPTAAALLIFMGAIGKSAQFPLHVWLPDAMEGPTPVSALIHAATMVAAGVFLVARFFWLFEMSRTAMLTVAWIGAITAFGAATIGVLQYDIKRILAYSTISQLGYMMIGMGVGAAGAGMFHLLTHAYFKALLFLGSGAVVYGCRHIQDIRYMGGLARRMPITYWTFLIGTLALSGMFPLAGFWSKDDILASAFKFAMDGHQRTDIANAVHTVVAANPANYLIFILALAGAFLTAFYMFRLMSYVFLGGPNRDWKFRGPESPEYGVHHRGETDTPPYAAYPVPPGPFAAEEHAHEHESEPAEPREVPPSMWIPLAILAVFSTLYGLIGMPFMGEKNLIAKFLHPGAGEPGEFSNLALGLMVVSLAVVIGGILFGLEINNTERGVQLKRYWKSLFPGLYRTVYNKYFIDEFYEEFIIQPVFLICQVARTFDNWVVDGLVNLAGWLTWMIAQIQGWWDNNVIDGLVNGVAWVVGYLSDFVKPIQSGYVQNYMMVIVIFVLLYLAALFVKIVGA